MSLFQHTLSCLEAMGILLKQDKQYPNVVTIITGETLSSSWWAHPKSHEIFTVLEQLSESGDVLVTKLVDRKDTFIHRRLVPDLIAIANSGEAWQFNGISPEAIDLFRQVQQDGEAASSGSASRELRVRLLVNYREIHTIHGSHGMILESWAHFCKRTEFKPVNSAVESRSAMENCAEDLGINSKYLAWNSLEKKSAPLR